MVPCIKPALFAAALTFLFGSPAAVQVVILNEWRGERHMACLENVASDPSTGMALANDWLDHGGRFAAQHCQAVAEASIGDPAAAARAFAGLAAVLPDDRWGDIGQLWAQAGHAWLLAEEPQEALGAFNQAVRELPDDPNLLADRAVVQALLGDFRAAADDLTRALERRGDDPELLLYRATAYRYLENLRGGLADLDRALTLAPDFPEALLERGNQRALVGDDQGAAEDWRRVRLLVRPESDLAQQAAANLNQLNAN
ncbi:MAG: hypothetical protein AAFY02_04840 [Pseudomonadota bacterium]